MAKVLRAFLSTLLGVGKGKEIKGEIVLKSGAQWTLSLIGIPDNDPIPG